MRFTAAVLLVAFVAVATSVRAQSEPKYVLGLLPQNLSGYTLASIADLKTADFVNQYNSGGINYVQTIPGNVCCGLRVVEGFVAYGHHGNFSYVESFVAGTDTCTSSTMPQDTTFGCPTFLGGPYAGTWLSTLASGSTAMLTTNASGPSIDSSCGGSPNSGHSFIAIFKKIAPTPTPAPTVPLAPYIVHAVGPDYPAPTGYVQMSLFDVQSDAFIQYYNKNGIKITSPYTDNYCCMLRIADGGWLTYGAEHYYSPVSLFDSNGSWNCGVNAIDIRLTLGGTFGGPYTGTLLPQLNSTVVQLFGFLKNDTKHDYDGCVGLPDTLALWTSNWA